MPRWTEKQVHDFLARTVANYDAPLPRRTRPQMRVVVPGPKRPARPARRRKTPPSLPLAPAATEHMEFQLALPPPSVHQNARPGNWGQQLRVVAAYRAAVAEDLRSQLPVSPPPMFQKAKLSLLFIMQNRLRRDILNWAGAMKPAIDALVDVGLLRDDDSSHLEIGFISMRLRGPAEVPCVMLLLDPVVEEAPA